MKIVVFIVCVYGYEEFICVKNCIINTISGTLSPMCRLFTGPSIGVEFICSHVTLNPWGALISISLINWFQLGVFPPPAHGRLWNIVRPVCLKLLLVAKVKILLINETLLSVHDSINFHFGLDKFIILLSIYRSLILGFCFRFTAICSSL